MTTVYRPASPIEYGPAGEHARHDPAFEVAPSAENLGPVLDISTLLFAVQIEQQHSQEASHEASIVATAAEIKHAIDQARLAAEQAREAAGESSFWSKIVSTVKIIGAVGTVAAGVASGALSGGVSTVGALAMAGVLLSTCSKPIAGLCGGSDKLQRDFAMGLALGGAALSLGAAGVGLATGAGTAASLSEGVKMGAQLARVGGNVLAGGAAVAQGYATIELGSSQADQVNATADGVDARTHKRVMQQTLDDLVQSLKTLTRSFEGAKKALADAQEQIGKGNYSMLVTLGR